MDRSPPPPVPGTRTALPPRVAEAVVFLASASVLVLEIVALRLVAPYVGITLQTSSAVIGSALGAIATGAWAGGRSADRWDPGALLAPILGLGGALTVATRPVVRGIGEALAGGPNAPAALLLAMAAVFPPAALLSAVTPLVVKLHLAELSRTGTVVGRLSAIATLGAITATFATGFVLLVVFGTGTLIIGTGSLLMAAAAALAAARGFGRLGRRTGAALTVTALLPLPLLAPLTPNPCAVETAYHCVRVETDPDRAGGRLLWLDDLAHSYVDLDDPGHLEFSYAGAIAAVVDETFPGNRPITSLSVGGGGLSLPRYLAAARPGSAATVLEIDPGVAAVARQRLGADTIPALRIRVGDARVALGREEPAGYDLVIGDAFGGLAVPWHLTTREAVAEVRRTLAPGGLYVVNVIDYRPQRFARAEVATLRALFPYVVIAAEAETLTGVGGGNHLLIASMTPLPTAQLQAAVRARVPGWDLLDPAGTAAFTGATPALTDDRAPVDQLISG
ncbi:MAG: fused MFS/spermidine synthase [Kineosporiaceae bacterium]